MFFNYEKRIRLRSPPEKVDVCHLIVHIHSSLKGNELYAFAGCLSHSTEHFNVACIISDQN